MVILAKTIFEFGKKAAIVCVDFKELKVVWTTVFGRVVDGNKLLEEFDENLVSVEVEGSFVVWTNVMPKVVVVIKLLK